MGDVYLGSVAVLVCSELYIYIYICVVSFEFACAFMLRCSTSLHGLAANSVEMKMVRYIDLALS